MDIINDLEKLKRNGIVCKLVEPKANASSNCQFGGRPYLPSDVEWFRNSNKKGNPLSFIAQFDLKELKKFDLDDELPKDGILYFFYDFEEEPIGCMPKEKNGAKIFYYEGNGDELEEREFPSDLKEEFCLKKFSIEFSNRTEIPMCEEYEEITQNDIDYDEYDEISEQMGMLYDDEDTKLLGYADLCQESVLLQCEMIRNGIKCNNFKYLKYKDKYIKDASEWVLLFQADVFENSEDEISIGDGGRLYYYIRKCDLKNKKFENGWFVTQCY